MMMVMCLTGAKGISETMVTAAMVSIPSGPNSGCSFRLYLNPNDTDISAFGFKVYYHNEKVGGMSVTDNTGQSGKGWLADMGGETLSADHLPECNVYREFVVTTTKDLIMPVNLALVGFTTQPMFSGPPSSIKIFFADGTGLVDENYAYVTHSFSPVPLLAPVMVSRYSLE